MLEGIAISNSISFILVFIEGLISFFSPCVIPLIPVYMGYLAGNGKKIDEDGTILYERKKVFLHTAFFALGISFAFFILGMAFTTLGMFFNNNKILFTRIGGIFIILLGLFQLGIFDLSFLQKERRFKLNFGNKEMNPIIALIMGFTFSFAWTPCIGPALSSVLIMASGAKTSLQGNLLVLLYAFGFLVPFLLLGLFTTQVLNFLKNNKRIMKYAIKVGGVILIIMGIMTFTGWMNNVSSYLNSYTYRQRNNSKNTVDDKDVKDETGNNEDTDKTDKTDNTDITDKTDTENTKNDDNADNTGSGENSETGNQDKGSKTKVIPAFDFTLIDQYGNEHTLSDYKGKVVFLNFWATWCPPCQKEMPDIEKLYNEYNLNQDEVIFLGVANPVSEEYPNNQDVKKEEIIAFLEENEFTFPTVFDETGKTLKDYYISAFPTTFMIDKEGNIYGYVAGMLTKDIMINIINQTIEATETTK